MLIFGWIGFNPGSALLLPVSSNQGFIAGHSAVTTVLSAAGGTISALLINGFMTYRHTGEFDFDVYVAMNGWCVDCFNNMSMKSFFFDLRSPDLLFSFNVVFVLLKSDRFSFDYCGLWDCRFLGRPFNWSRWWICVLAIRSIHDIQND